MKILTLPIESRPIVVATLTTQLAMLGLLAMHQDLSIFALVLAFFAATFLADLITGLFHFGFDYVWPDRFPVMGPISVEFRQHHDRPMLDPSAWWSNLTRGAYMGFTFAVITLLFHQLGDGSSFYHFFACATLMGISLWGTLFHQVHSYTHMGKNVPPDVFNEAVERISKLPKKEQAPEFEKLFAEVGIPKFVRLLQRCRLLLRPEIHWRHHINFESDFSSLNGWSDPLTNIFFGPFARYRKRQKEEAEAKVMVAKIDDSKMETIKIHSNHGIR